MTANKLLDLEIGEFCCTCINPLDEQDIRNGDDGNCFYCSYTEIGYKAGRDKLKFMSEDEEE